MKKLILAIILGVTLGGTAFFIQSGGKTESSSQEVSITVPQPTTSSTHPVENTFVIESPTLLRIPTLNVRANIEHVGLDSERRMDVPKDFQNAAWYELGHKPGEMGSAVIAGHFDTPQGGPGVFFGLEDLKPGDEIIIEDESEKLIYAVTDVQRYEFDDVPLNKVFDARDKKRLNLITCEGVFDKTSKNYSKRLIVYSVLKE